MAERKRHFLLSSRLLEIVLWRLSDDARGAHFEGSLNQYTVRVYGLSAKPTHVDFCSCMQGDRQFNLTKIELTNLR